VSCSRLDDECGSRWRCTKWRQREHGRLLERESVANTMIQHHDSKQRYLGVALRSIGRQRVQNIQGRCSDAWLLGARGTFEAAELDRLLDATLLHHLADVSLSCACSLWLAPDVRRFTARSVEYKWADGVRRDSSKRWQ